MKTHIGKIARLPLAIRQQLNQRLQNGEMGRPLLNWLNDLPEVQAILAELFSAKPITKQNLSDWRHSGYEDWLRHQARQEAIQRIAEQGLELEQRENNQEIFESFARILIAEWSETVESLHTVRDPNLRLERLQKVSREFARIQNGFNWSRHVNLEWVKYNDQFEDEEEYDHNQPPVADNASQPPLLTIESSEEFPVAASPAESQAGPGENESPESPASESEPPKLKDDSHPIESETPETETEPQEPSTPPRDNMVWTATEETPWPAQPGPNPPNREPAPIVNNRRSLSPVPIRGQRWRQVEG